MSSQTEATADPQSGEKADEKKEGTETTTATTTVTVTDNKSMKKVRSKKDTIYFICSLACLQCQCQYQGCGRSPEQDQLLLAHDLPLPRSPLTSNNLKNDPSRFESPGINFNAKLIGIDEISSARGDKMCQESIQRLKLAVKSSGQHKQKIIVNVSLEGVRLIDLRSQAVNHTHLVHRISFISRDITDSRAFGYVYGAGEGKHKFYAIKTEKAAEALVLSLRDLFQAVYEMKKKEVEEAKQKHEEIEKAEEAKDAQEPVYQEKEAVVKVVPKNGAPVENKEDPTYQVPTNNAPVTKSEDNLLNLENELESIEKGIEQINDLEDMFTDIRSPTTTASSSAAWGDDLASLSTGQTQAPTQPAFSVGGAPFSAPPSTMPQGNNPMFGQPFPAPGPRPGFGAQPWGTTPSPQPGMVAGFPGASPNPFGAPSLPPRVGVGLPPPPGGFPPTPFPGPGQLNRPGFPAVPPQNVGAPAPAPANDPFGDPFAVGDSGGGFDDNLLTPDKIEVPSEEPEQPPPGKKDAFGDLVAIGPKDKQTKSPKQMFVELATPPKKSLNELKVEKSPSPKPVSPTGFQASGATDGDQENPASSLDFSTLNQFGDKDPFGSGDPFGSSDPFVNCFPNPAQKQDAAAPKLELPAQNGTNSSSAPSPNALFGGSIFDDDFNLPVPKEPPPPLPTSIDSVSHSSLNIPPPPPRNNISVYTPSNTQHTPPLPPRPRSSSDKNRAADVLHVQPTPPLPPRRYLNSTDSNSSVPNDELSRESPKDSSSVNSQDAELNEQSQTISNNNNNVSEAKGSSNNDNNVSEAKGISNNNKNVIEAKGNSSNNDNNVSEAKNKLSLASDTSLSLSNEKTLGDRTQSDQIDRELTIDNHKPFEKGEVGLNNSNTSELKRDDNESVSQTKLDKTKCDSQVTPNVSDEKLKNLNNNSVSNSSGDQTNCDIERISNASSSSSQTETVTERVRTGRAFIKEADSNYHKSLSVSVSDPFETIDPFASDDPFTQNDPFSPDPFASDPFSDSISTTSVSSTTSSNDPFTSAITSQKSSSSTNVDASDDPFSVFDNTFEPFHFDKSKKSKVKLKF